MTQDTTIARLALEDGSIFRGAAFGHTAPALVDGEACFNTSLTGYQEILTDPSYAGQIVTMTCPLIGNYGITPEDLESRRIFLAGFAVRELAERDSNYRATQHLSAWLDEQGIPAITGIDTRALTRKLRVTGALKSVLCTDPAIEDGELVERAKNSPGLVGRNLVADVSRPDTETWTADLDSWDSRRDTPDFAARRRVVAIDCGAKHNILRHLVANGCDVTVVPYDTPAEAILEHKPEGIFLSNGPGDPSAVEATVETARSLIGKLPIFGICLGHQLLSRALGAETFKLKFGHRGGNQPVQNLGTQKVEITSQNHGFAVDIDSLEKAGGESTHINLNDRTLEGFRHKDHPLFAVQYHPEASPGPHDAAYLFDCFATMMESGNSPSAADMDNAQRARNKVVSV
ncbi:glutamine-hydrolyzing carbamoyl-phosphate synthase small subunit [Mucisphaera calidilacus]|uniref:Carbamoyl phosphate synthase small chain n=1 Tax=Mucisphaera calidilacus TaxID=2527982 RepID=A0A518BWE2_9BACT|nr:glutamine-hydrolyzing carbamoyl-phosphate synthase small subunit [Mucisphaera calidilacus]QDU71299.1 Carbamoyl-phosphate synthase small chain [Mucisphaera calidilacus]